MVKEFPDDTLTLHTDAYQINMIQTYWNKGIHNKTAIFEVFFRNMPFDNGYAVFAGLDRIIDYISNLHFSESDIEYLKDVAGYPDDFLAYLKDFHFRGTIRSAVEGDLVFNNEPIL